MVGQHNLHCAAPSVINGLVDCSRLGAAALEGSLLGVLVWPEIGWCEWIQPASVAALQQGGGGNTF